ncbi:aspartyl/glutamyl-tRNA(Asn/Gln) amidotransferase, B subunit [Kwoniella bestiolae CBS 10118]|uniref:Glutamyl-tRNA(Gln) amidotransferase subunit B, mitochondrial n=1 Tax=Kwoniella bestiolae CBS 10118 TaxID=1296100 RepID=A0A1B9FYQ2_9TREE|nr:aspartyl/glutamyl-tRNA(Asn/Gln) amidotransferase, B subunit [Kwoniella bestiolae CBS 10118]OCF23899.1 aspartyl/glutamyl-tRNA(Asn/Gln) amidotransferase, B subunit [Kwoniella bestiolae CBS 10118]
MIILSRWGFARPPILPFLSGSSRGYATTKKKVIQGEEEWETVIGLEIHAQLKTGRKLFSPASTSYGEVPNTNVNLHDAAFPGTLPVLDLHAVRLSLITALALNCRVNPRSTFDRKHYFYHDIPASYQITQHYNPLARNGRLPIIQGENNVKRTFDVGIHQLQIEQDTAKSQTVGENTLVDLNRAGTGLMEIVTEPDMRSAEEAGAFVRKLQGLLRRLGSGDGDMEKGNLRVDVNVSVHRHGTPFGTRCEIKNINSVRFLQAAIESERRRHIQHYLTSPNQPIKQETRGLNELTLETFSLRSKEEAMDYRYMPDSNLPAVVVDPIYLDKLRNDLPEMPWEVIKRLTETYGVQKRDVETLIGLDEYNFDGIRYYEDVIGVNGDKKIAKKAMNWIVHELLGQIGKLPPPWSPTLVPSTLMRDMILLIEDGKITGTTGKAIIKHLISTSSSTSNEEVKLEEVLSTLGIEINDETSSGGGGIEMQKLCEQAMANQPKSVVDYRKGNEKVLMRLVGEVMKLSKGRADARKVKEVLVELLK